MLCNEYTITKEEAWGVRYSCYFEPTLYDWDSYILAWKSSHHAVEDGSAYAVAHLAIARTQNAGNGIVGFFAI